MSPRRRFDPDAVDGLVRQHFGAVRTADLLSAGMSSGGICHRCRPGGPWQRALIGVVFAFSGVPSALQRISAALLFARTGAVVTGLTALRLRNFRDLPADNAVHLLIPHRRQRKSESFALVERTRRLPSHTWVQKVPCAPVARAVIDACRRIQSFDAVRAIIAEAVQRHHCELADLLRELREAPSRGTKLPRQAVLEVVAGVRSVAEAHIRDRIRRRGIPEPLWNHHVFGPDGRWLAQPDGIWAELGVVLEVDSRAWHLSPKSWYRSLAKMRRMAAIGLIVIPVTPTDVRDDPDGVLDQVEQALAAASNRPAPAITVTAP